MPRTPMAEQRPPGDAELFNPELATPAWRRRLKASEFGRVAAMLYRRRRAPGLMLRAPGGLRAASQRVIPPLPSEVIVRGSGAT